MAFLDPTLRSLMPDPDQLTDAPKAAERLADAIARRETVAIFGDYDVDGAASSAILCRFLRHFGWIRTSTSLTGFSKAMARIRRQSTG